MPAISMEVDGRFVGVCVPSIGTESARPVSFVLSKVVAVVVVGLRVLSTSFILEFVASQFKSNFLVRIPRLVPAVVVVEDFAYHLATHQYS